MALLKYKPEFLEALCALYNGEGAFSPFISHLTPKLFERRIAAKAFFEPEGAILATSGGRLVGAVFATFAPSADKTHADLSRGVIDGLFFSERHPAVGDQLLGAALTYLRSRGAKSVIGWATEGGYPFWRDLYCGSEPVMHAGYKQAYDAFSRAGFAKTQHSVAMLARVEGEGPALKAEYRIRNCPSPRETFWERNTWLDLWPMCLEAEAEGVVAGRLGWVALPATSRRRGVRTVGIYSVVVAEAWRRRGVASALLARCFEEAKKDGAEEILLATGVENRPAIAAYHKFGFSEVFELVGMNRIAL